MQSSVYTHRHQQYNQSFPLYPVFIHWLKLMFCPSLEIFTFDISNGCPLKGEPSASQACFSILSIFWRKNNTFVHIALFFYQHGSYYTMQTVLLVGTGFYDLSCLLCNEHKVCIMGLCKWQCVWLHYVHFQLAEKRI